MKKAREKLYILSLIIILIVLIYVIFGFLHQNSSESSSWIRYSDMVWTSTLFDQCKYHNKMIFTVNDFDYDEKLLDVDINIRLINESRLINNKTEYQEELNKGPFFFQIPHPKFGQFYYYSSFFDKKDDMTYDFKGKIPLVYPTHKFPFEGPYFGIIEIKDYGINYEKNGDECFDYKYIRNVKDPYVVVVFSPGDKYEKSNFKIFIERPSDPYKPRIILIIISLILILCISVYLLMVKDNTIEGILTLFISLFILQSFKPQQIKSFTLFDDTILTTFFIGLIIMIFSLLKKKILEILDRILIFLSDLPNKLNEIFLKFIRKRI